MLAAAAVSLHTVGGGGTFAAWEDGTRAGEATGGATRATVGVEGVGCVLVSRAAQRTSASTRMRPPRAATPPRTSTLRRRVASSRSVSRTRDGAVSIIGRRASGSSRPGSGSAWAEGCANASSNVAWGAAGGEGGEGGAGGGGGGGAGGGGGGRALDRENGSRPVPGGSAGGGALSEASRSASDPSSNTSATGARMPGATRTSWSGVGSIAGGDSGTTRAGGGETTATSMRGGKTAGGAGARDAGEGAACAVSLVSSA